jgi:hypothetical protein
LLSGKARILSGKMIRRSDKVHFWNSVIMVFVFSALGLVFFIYELFR